LAEFALNNQESETTKSFPFMANYGYYLKVIETTLECESTDGKDHIKKIQDIQVMVYAEMLYA